MLKITQELTHRLFKQDWNDIWALQSQRNVAVKTSLFSLIYIALTKHLLKKEILDANYEWQ